MKVGNCVLAPDFCHFGIDDFPFKIPLKKVLQNRLFSALASRSGNSFALWNSVSADRSGVAASTFLAAAAASVILLCFASECCESHGNGCMKVANGALAADFCHFGIDDFPLKIFPLWRRDPVLELQNRCNWWSCCA